MKRNKYQRKQHYGIMLLAGVILILGLAAVFLSRAPAQAVVAQIGDTQEVRMDVEGFRYTPSVITVEAGKPVHWIVDGTDASGCTRHIIFKEFGISQRLERGENIIDFTPTKKGTYTFTCGMGMVRGTMNVV